MDVGEKATTASFELLGEGVSPVVLRRNQTDIEISCNPVMFRFVLYVCVLGVLCILGFIGNIVSFIVLRKDGSSPVASFQLQALAVSDNVLIFFWTNHYILGYLLDYLDVAWFSLPRFFWFWRIYSYPVIFIAQTETIWLTVSIASNRYVVVRMPLRAKRLCTIKNVRIQVIAVTVFSIVYNLPRFFERVVPDEEHSSVTTYYIPTWLSLNPVYLVVYMHVLYQLVTFAIPLALLAFLNTSIMVAYRAAMKRRRMMSSHAKNENNIMLVMIVVVSIFMITQAPARIVQIVWDYRSHFCSISYYLIHTSMVLEASNSLVNFLIYFSLRPRFRMILLRSCCKRFREAGSSGRGQP